VVHDTENGPAVLSSLNASGFVEMAVGIYYNLRLESSSGCDIGLGTIEISNGGCAVNGESNMNAIIAGTTWLDENAILGLREQDEDILEGIVVNAINLEGLVETSTITDENGNYSLSMKAGSYFVEFEVPALLTETVPHAGVDESSDSDLDMSNGQGTTGMYHIEAGQVFPNVDAGFLHGVLPVTWENITAKNKDKYNQIDWTMADEGNTRHYEIERSVSSIQSFETIDRVAVPQASRTVLNYRYEDFEIEKAGVYYYRVKQVSEVGKYHYSKVVSVEVEKDQLLDEADLVSIYPNPIATTATLNLDKMGKYSRLKAKLYNNIGLLVAENIIDGETSGMEGIKSYEIDFTKYPTGSYTLYLELDGQELHKTIVIAKEK